MVFYGFCFLITLFGFCVNIVFCIIDAQEFKKLQKRVKALEDKK